MANDRLRQELLDLACALATTSPEVLRVAHMEDDVTTAVAADAAHFLKLNGQRLGRDLELYGFMGEKTAGWQATLPLFFEEVVMPLKRVAPASYSIACEKLGKMGEMVYPAEIRSEWNSILAM